jgi:hypothetical protein
MFVARSDLEKILREVIDETLKNGGESKKAADLQKEIVKLEIERDKKLEEFARKEREVEHKIGLERKRQEFEITQAQRETTVKVREENLAADKERFKSEMEFQRKHLESEIQSLRELVGQMLKRLPSAEITMEVKRGNR